MKRVWVVDDHIPVQELYGGPYPVRLDVDIVRHLVDNLSAEAWEEPVVLELCRALCAAEYEATFFLSPDSMLRGLEQGTIPPHAVVFDWEYPGSDGNRNRAALEQVLESTFAYVQVYTHLGAEGVEPIIADLRGRFRGRLLPVETKAVVTAAELASRIREAWEGTIAGEVADKVRAQVLRAVERTLIDICGVSKGGIAAMVQGESDNLVQLVLSKVRDEIGSSDSAALDAIVAAQPDGESSVELRRLMSVWYYYFPSDDLVRRGDLIEVDGSLGLVVTPACDLVKFPKKAGRRLTWIKVVQLDGQGITDLRASGLELNDVGNSIIAAHGRAGEALVVLPNVPVAPNSREGVADYVALCHAWENRPIVRAVGGELTYDRLDGIVRRCALADPFASAVVARVTSVIASPGTPDLPKGEVARLRKLIAPPAAAAAVVAAPKQE